MDKPKVRESAEPKIENGRDLLLCLYGEIGISAVAAAVEMSRQPAPEEAKPEVRRELPPLLRNELAA